MVEVRPARPEDGPALQEIEMRTGERFREIGMPEIADDDPFPVATLTAYADAGRSWVAVDEHDEPIGYAVVDLVDGRAHLEQISVMPDRQGRGIGRALIEQVQSWAVAHGCAHLTLTTYRDVLWNGPLYAHLGFVELTVDQIGPELARLQGIESAHGLDPSTRIAMALDLR